MSRIMPPIDNRFKKGTSGNPYGRPRITGKEIFEISNMIFELLLQAKYKDRSVLIKLKKIREILNEK
jgi:hypothetical protein